MPGFTLQDFYYLMFYKNLILNFFCEFSYLSFVLQRKYFKQNIRTKRRKRCPLIYIPGRISRHSGKENRLRDAKDICLSRQDLDCQGNISLSFSLFFTCHFVFLQGIIESKILANCNWASLFFHAKVVNQNLL